MRARYLLLWAIVLLVLAACADSKAESGTATTAHAGLGLPPGFHAELYARGLDGPTAMAFGPDGALYITQLHGGENARLGQVMRVAGPDAVPQAVLDGLTKPTGLAWDTNALLLAAGQEILRAPFSDGQLGTPMAVVRELPSNGRSEGQLTWLPDGSLLFEASGAVGNAASGRLLTIRSNDMEPREYARGLKNAYAHAVDQATGQVYTSEIGDDPMDGTAPPEEINLVRAGADYGWPRCYAMQVAAHDRGGDAASCAATEPPVITFPPHSTPSGLAFYAGRDFPAAFRDALYVALWNGNPPTVLHVALRDAGGQVIGTATPFIDGLVRPIALLVDPSGGLLVLDQGAGVVYRITYRAQ